MTLVVTEAWCQKVPVKFVMVFLSAGPSSIVIIRGNTLAFTLLSAMF